MKVLNKYIIVDKLVEKKTTSSGLLLSGDEYKDMRYQYGKVINYGPLVSGIEAGDKIMFDRVSGHEVIIDETRMFILQEKDVVCIL
jgi:co-chaperonin GroES (HSP10)